MAFQKKNGKNTKKSQAKKKGNTILYLVQYLEKRLDNCVYRLGLAPTRASARQLVCHGHISVNGKKMTIPSYLIKANEVITIANEKTTKIPYIEKQLNNKDIIIPVWFEKKATAGKMIAEPTRYEIEKQVNLRLIIEYYSR